MKMNITVYSMLFLFLTNISCVAQKPLQTQISKKVRFPKTLIYDARSLPISIQDYFDLGFSHISAFCVPDPVKIPNNRKYLLWGYINVDESSNWRKSYSPFGNNLKNLEREWKRSLDRFEKSYHNFKDKNQIDIIVADYEAKLNEKQLKNNPPFQKGKTRVASKAIDEYKVEMRKLYDIPLKYAKKNYSYYKKWSSYSDVPIENTWWTIPDKTWNDWTTNPTNLNYITHTIVNGKPVETEFSKSLNFYTPSTYYFYSPSVSGEKVSAQYLAYMLFQLEANMAWTKKPVVLYHWFAYQGSRENRELIDETMIRNSVLFAFISGAEGMVLYDDDRNLTNDKRYIDRVAVFSDAIASLSKYNSYFTNSNVTFFKPENARDLFANHKPVIRGIVKDGKMLLVAANPFAREKETTNLTINYLNKRINITLKGKNALLQEINLY